MPSDVPIRVSIDIARERPPAGTLAQIGAAVRTHFAREASLQRLRLRKLVREGRWSLGIGLASLVLCMPGATMIS